MRRPLALKQEQSAQQIILVNNLELQGALIQNSNVIVENDALI